MAEKIEQCILCDTQCSLTPGIDSVAHINCVNCGDYKVKLAEIINLPKNKEFKENRHLLSGLSYYNTVNQLEPLLISKTTMNELITKNKIPITFNEKSELLLMHMFDLADGRAGVKIKKIPFTAAYGKDEDDFSNNLKDLKDQGLVEYKEYEYSNAGPERMPPKLTIYGVKKVEELREASHKKGNNLIDAQGNRIVDENGAPIVFGSIDYNNQQHSEETQIESEDDDENDYIIPEKSYDSETDNSEFSIPNNIYIRESNSTPKLNIKTVASAYADLINNTASDDNRGTFGVLGKWGRGKTYFINQLKKNLKNSKGFENIIIDFSAWQYQKTPEIWAYLYENIARERFKGWCKVPYIFLHNCKKRKWGIITDLILPVTWMLIIKLWLQEDINISDTLSLSNDVLTFIPPIILALGKILKDSLSDMSKVAVNFVKKHITRKSFGHILGLQKEIQDELRTLLQSWIGKRAIINNNKKIILIVDDIDRCNPDNVLDLLDSLRVVLDDNEISKRLKIIIAVDHLIVKDMMKNRFKEYFHNSDNNEEKEKRYIRDYFDKLFLFSLHLAPLSLPEIDQIIDSIFETSLAGVNEKDGSSSPIVQEENKPEFAEDLNTPLKTKQVNDVEDSNSNNNTPVGQDQSQEKNKTAVSNIKPMTNDELLSFKTLIAYHGCTPRRMRILYYRYIFMKCLLDSLEGGFDTNRSQGILESIAKYEKDGVIENSNVNKQELLDWILFD